MKFFVSSPVHIPLFLPVDQEIDISGSELIEPHIAAQFCNICELLRECPIFAKSGGRYVCAFTID
jgi:hypothetical protein